MKNQLIEIGDVRQALTVAGWDIESELAGMAVEATQLELPRVRIEHKDSGRHRMYVDSLERYMDAENQETKLPGNKLTAVVFAEQFIRALWKQSDEIPTCSAIDDTPLTVEPISDSCRHCEHGVMGGACKPKVRLLLLAEIEGDIRPLIMTLSPTSIKHWNAHKKKLRRSNLPVVAINTTFELVDTKRGTYRWAEVKVSMDGIASKELLVGAKTARTEFDDLTRRISDADFGDSGDKQHL